MSNPYAGNPDNWPDLITILSDGDAKSAASVAVGLEGLADRTASLGRDALFAKATNFVPRDLVDMEPTCGLFDPVKNVWFVFGVDGGAADAGLYALDAWKFGADLGATFTSAIEPAACAISPDGNIVVMGASNTYYISDQNDPTIWGTQVFPGSGVEIVDVVYDDAHGIYIALGSEGGATKIWTSPTAGTGSWTVVVLAASGRTPLALVTVPSASASFPGRCIAIAHATASAVSFYWSDDVSTFDTASGPLAALPSGLAYSVLAETLMVVLVNGDVFTSDDGGETFSARDTGVLGGLARLVVDGNLWVALHDAGGGIDVVASRDLGDTWYYTRAFLNAGSAGAVLVASDDDERLMIFAEDEVGVGLRQGTGRLA